MKNHNENENEIEIDTIGTKSKTNTGRGYDVTQSVFYLRQNSVHDNTRSYNRNKNKNENRNKSETNQKEFSDKIDDLNLTNYKDRFGNHDEGDATNIDNDSYESAKDEKTTLFINTSMLVSPFTEEVCSPFFLPFTKFPLILSLNILQLTMISFRFN